MGDGVTLIGGFVREQLRVLCIRYSVPVLHLFQYFLELAAFYQGSTVCVLMANVDVVEITCFSRCR
jgi:hypothetical protein